MFQLQLFFCSIVTNGTALQLCRDTSLSQELHYCSYTQVKKFFFLNHNTGIQYWNKFLFKYCAQYQYTSIVIAKYRSPQKITSVNSIYFAVNPENRCLPQVFVTIILVLPVLDSVRNISPVCPLETINCYKIVSACLSKLVLYFYQT